MLIRSPSVASLNPLRLSLYPKCALASAHQHHWLMCSGSAVIKADNWLLGEKGAGHLTHNCHSWHHRLFFYSKSLKWFVSPGLCKYVQTVFDIFLTFLLHLVHTP